MGTGSPSISSMTVYNGKAYFNANDGVNGQELWVSDGTEAGTQIFMNIHPTGNGNPMNLKVANNFCISLQTHRELYLNPG